MEIISEKPYSRKAEQTKSFISSIIAETSKQSPEFTHVVIRSLNLLYWLGNLSKTFLSWAALITHKMTEQTHWEINSNSERERWPTKGQQEAVFRSGLSEH